jgi:hypothetical protein
MTPPTDTRRAPWEIEIRERGSAPPSTPAGPPGPDGGRRRGAGGRLVALVVLGVACFAATVALLGWLTGGGDDEAAEGDAPATTTPITFAPREDAPSTTAEATTTTTTSTSTTTTTTPTTTSTPPTTATPSGTGSVPALSPSFGGGWVAMLTSVPYSAGTGRLEAAYAEARRVVPDAVAARGEDWASLGDGYWAVVRTGFASAAEARSFCAGVDSGRVDCAARELRRG